MDKKWLRKAINGKRGKIKMLINVYTRCVLLVVQKGGGEKGNESEENLTGITHPRYESYMSL